MKSQKRVIASMLSAVIVLTLLTVFPHAETAGQNSCDSCTQSGSSQSSVMEKALDMRQNSSAGQASAVTRNSHANSAPKASQNNSSNLTSSAGKSSSVAPASSVHQNNVSGLTSSAGKSSSAATMSSVGQQSGFVQPSSGVVSTAEEIPKSSDPVSQSKTIQGAASKNTLLTDAEISPQTIADGLGPATDFAVFARNFTLNSHMEGNIAVHTFSATTGNIGNSTNIYSHNQSGSIMFDLSISISGIAKHEYHVGIYFDATAKKLWQDVPLTTDSSGNAATTVPGLDSKKVYYAYLLDSSGYPILSGTSQQGITGGGSVVYSCNDSYIQSLTVPDDKPEHKIPITWELFQNALPGSTVMPQSATFGNKYRLCNSDGILQTTGNGNYGLVDASNNQNVITKIGGGTDNTVSIEETFPFVFDTVFANLSDFSAKLSKMSDCNSGIMRVINVSPSNSDDNALKAALINVLDFGDNDLVNPEKGVPLTANQYLVVNVNCGSNTSVTIPPCCIGTVNYDAHWNDISTRILWNFYGRSKTLAVKTTTGVLGTILAPAATVNYGSTMDGAIYADTVYNGSGEIHKMAFHSNSNVTRSVSFTDHSTPPFALPETGGPGTEIFYLAGVGILFLAAVAVFIHRVVNQNISARGKQHFDHISVFLLKHRLSIYQQQTENNSS